MIGYTAGRDLKRMPSEVYWGGLGAWVSGDSTSASRNMESGHLLSGESDMNAMTTGM